MKRFMDIQHFREVYLRKSPISFRYILLSLAVSVIINGAALCALLSIRTPLFFSRHNNILTVSITNISNKREKTQQNRKNKNSIQKTAVRKNTKQLPKSAKETVKTESPKNIIKEKTVHVQKIQHLNTTLPIRQKQAVSIKPVAKTGAFENRKSNAGSNLNIICISKDNCPHILSWIEKHKFYPLSAIYKQEEDRVALNFTIRPSGKITTINIEKPSKYTKLNLAAVKILENSSPIPLYFLGCIKRLPAKAQATIAFKLE